MSWVCPWSSCRLSCPLFEPAREPDRVRAIQGGVPPRPTLLVGVSRRRSGMRSYRFDCSPVAPAISGSGNWWVAFHEKCVKLDTVVDRYGNHLSRRHLGGLVRVAEVDSAAAGHPHLNVGSLLGRATGPESQERTAPHALALNRLRFEGGSRAILADRRRHFAKPGVALFGGAQNH